MPSLSTREVEGANRNRQNGQAPYQKTSSTPGMVTGGPKNGQPPKLSLFCHHSPVKLREIRGNQVISKTVQVVGWQEDVLYLLAPAEGAESV